MDEKRTAQIRIRATVVELKRDTHNGAAAVVFQGQNGERFTIDIGSRSSSKVPELDSLWTFTGQLGW